jgi:hypothetical protein
LPAFALLSAALIVGLQSPGRLRSMLSLSAFVFVGRMSYGLYLFHWPVFVLLRERGWDLTSPWRLAIALAITFAIATTSYFALEQPVRRARWSFSITVRGAALASAVALAATQLVGPPAPFIQADDQLLSAASIAPTDSLVPLRPATASATPTPTAPITTTTAPVQSGAIRVASEAPAPSSADAPAPASSPAVVVETSTSMPTSFTLDAPPPRPVRIEVAGDSTALYVAQGLATWSLAHPDDAQVNVNWCPGCTFMLEPEVTTFDLDDLLESSRVTIGTNLPEAVRTLQPDVVVLMVTVNDVANRQWSEDEGPLTPRDPRYVERMTTAYANLTMTLLSEGAPNVAWVVPPRPNHLWLEPDMNEMDRYPIQHQVIRDVAAMFDHRVSVVDLDAWLTATGHDKDPWWRGDGVHLTDESGAALAELYLGPLLVHTAIGG